MALCALPQLQHMAAWVQLQQVRGKSILTGTTSCQ
jgi:hypothetical protein